MAEKKKVDNILSIIDSYSKKNPDIVNSLKQLSKDDKFIEQLATAGSIDALVALSLTIFGYFTNEIEDPKKRLLSLLIEKVIGSVHDSLSTEQRNIKLDNMITEELNKELFELFDSTLDAGYYIPSHPVVGRIRNYLVEYLKKQGVTASDTEKFANNFNFLLVEKIKKDPVLSQYLTNLSLVRAFISTPSGPQFSNIRRIIAESLIKNGVMPILIEKEYAAGQLLTDKILNLIMGSDLVIFDVSGNNPNIMFELGFTSAIRKPSILLRQEKDVTLPSEVMGFFNFVYNPEDPKSISKLITRSIESVLAGKIQFYKG